MTNQQQPTRSRGWVFTINNYTTQELINLDNVVCQYIVYGKEVGKQGTPHLQGYIHYTNAVRRKTVMSALGPRTHCEPKSPKSTLAQAINYCKKAATTPNAEKSAMAKTADGPMSSTLPKRENSTQSKKNIQTYTSCTNKRSNQWSHALSNPSMMTSITTSSGGSVQPVLGNPVPHGNNSATNAT